MKFALATLVATSSAIKINQTPATANIASSPLHYCSYSPPATAGVPTALGCSDIVPAGSMYANWMVIHEDTGTGHQQCAWQCVPVATTTTPATAPATTPAGQTAATAMLQCHHAPPTSGANANPGDMQCPNPQTNIQWLANYAGASDCSWQCGQIPMGPPAMPSRADQIKDFANGFFEQCDTDASSYISKKELKKCIKGLKKMMRRGAKMQIKMQRQQIWNQTKEQITQIKTVAKLVWNGAVKQQGATPMPDGISITDVTGFLQNNWEEVNDIMNQMNGEPGGDSGSSDSGYSGDSGDSGPPMCGTAPCQAGPATGNYTTGNYTTGH